MNIVHHFNINNFCYDIEAAAAKKSPLKAKNNPLITPLFSFTFLTLSFTSSKEIHPYIDVVA